MTKGDYRVGVSFNPSANTLVDQIKRQAADLIDLIDSIEEHPAQLDMRFSEIKRLKAIAQTHIEDAAMWAVKAATKPAMNN